VLTLKTKIFSSVVKKKYSFKPKLNNKSKIVLQSNLFSNPIFLILLGLGIICVLLVSGLFFLIVSTAFTNILDGVNTPENNSNFLPDLGLSGDTNSVMDIINNLNSNNSINSDSVVAINKLSPIAQINYFLEFNKVIVSISGEHFDTNLLKQLVILGNPPNIIKVLVDSKEITYDFNAFYSNAGFLSNLNCFVDSNILVEYYYDPDDFGGNYCIGDSCVIRLLNTELLPIEFTYVVNWDVNNFFVYNISLKENQPEPVFLITPKELYEKDNFILLKSQEKILTDSEINLSKFYGLVVKTNNFLSLSEKKVILFLVPDGMLQAFYFRDSEIIILPAYESNQVNATFVHEYTHFLLNQSEFPLWIQEGISEYVSKKVNYAACGMYVNSNISLLDWGVIDIEQEKIPPLYDFACNVFMNFDNRFGAEKTKELISELSKINSSDVYSQEYLSTVQNILWEVSQKTISINDFIERTY
jgi:hypothetical protein